MRAHSRITLEARNRNTFCRYREVGANPAISQSSQAHTESAKQSGPSNVLSLCKLRRILATRTLVLKRKLYISVQSFEEIKLHPLPALTVAICLPFAVSLPPWTKLQLHSLKYSSEQLGPPEKLASVTRVCLASLLRLRPRPQAQTQPPSTHWGNTAWVGALDYDDSGALGLARHPLRENRRPTCW